MADFTYSYLTVPGTADNYASTPDAAPLDVQGDIDLRAYINPSDWSVSGYRAIIGKALYAGGHRAYALALPGSGMGVVRLDWSATGSAWLDEDSTASVNVPNGTKQWVRATLDVNNGAGGYDVNFYTSTSAYTEDSPSWTQLGTTITGGATTSINAGDADVYVGRRDTAGSPVYFLGGIYRAQIYNGINGTLVFDAKFYEEEASTTTFTESSVQAATVTINQSGSPQAEIVAGDLGVTPAVSTVAVTGYVPTAVTGGTVVVPGAAELNLTGYTPTVITPYAGGGMTFDSDATTWDSDKHTFDEIAAGNVTIFPGVGELTIAGYVPTPSVSGGPVGVSPEVGELTITGYRPTISVTRHGLVKDVRVQPFYEVIRKLDVDEVDVTELEVFV